MPAKPTTVGDWLKKAERLYARHKVALGQVATTAHDEALYLLLHTLHLPLDSGARVLRRKLTALESVQLTDVFRRRLEDRVPAAYLTREAFLGEHRFYVDERVRSEGYDIELMAARRLGDIPTVPHTYINPLQPAISTGPRTAAPPIIQATARRQSHSTLGLD